MILEAITKPDSRIWYISPTYRQSKTIAFKMIKSYLPEEVIESVNVSELTFNLVNGSEIALKGADTEDALRGVGLTFAVLDEYASMRKSVWQEEVRPSLSDKQGGALFIGTPKGRNHFYDLFIKEDDEWDSFMFPTITNPYIPPKEVAQAKKDLAERIFSQEYEANFLTDETGVFKRVRACTVGNLVAPKEGRQYIIGCDLAKTEDFTVLVVIDTVTRTVVAFERFQDISWREQKLQIQALARRYNNGLVILDSTGVGDPILEDLQSVGVACEGYKFNNNTKNNLVNQLAIAIEQRQVTWPAELEVMTQELLEYEIQISDYGNFKYSAPEGKHDDCVISLGLAVWGIRSNLHEAAIVTQAQEAFYQDKQGRGKPVIPDRGRTYNVGGY